MSLESDADAAAIHQRMVSQIDETWSSGSAFLGRTFLMTVYISVIVNLISFPAIGFDPYAAVVTTGAALVAAPFVDVLRYRWHDFWLNYCKTRMLIGGNLIS